MYRDDGLALIKGNSGRLADKARKELCSLFLEFGLRITAEVNHQLVNFLDISFNLREESYLTHRKPDNDPLYKDKCSNHPPCITKQLPTSINRKILSLSSSKLAFDSTAGIYEDALHRSNYNTKLEYSPDYLASPSTQKRRRQRNIIWFNPPYSKNVHSNISRDFLKLVDKHFPKTNPLHKIFNRNNVKVSYSCMENVNSSISRHNKRMLRNARQTEHP